MIVLARASARQSFLVIFLVIIDRRYFSNTTGRHS